MCRSSLLFEKNRNWIVKWAVDAFIRRNRAYIHNNISDGIKEVSISHLKTRLFFFFLLSLLLVALVSLPHCLYNQCTETNTHKKISLNDSTSDHFKVHLIYLSVVMILKKCSYAFFFLLVVFSCLLLKKIALSLSIFHFISSLFCVCLYYVGIRLWEHWQELKRLIKVNTFGLKTLTQFQLSPGVYTYKMSKDVGLNK